MEPAECKRFARGGEVEEEVEESGIMMASSPNNFAELNMLAIDLFGKPYKDLTPDEMQMMQEELERLMNKFRSFADDEGIMQMASGYKTDMEEMYEQYVFEMEEQGLEPMSFAQFLARERAGMARGGMMKGPEWFQIRVEELMDQGYSYEEAGEIAYNEGVGGRYKDGGEVHDDNVDDLGPGKNMLREDHIDKMPNLRYHGSS